MQTDFIFQPRKAPRRRERQSSAPASLTISSVHHGTEPESVRIYFAGNIAWNGTDVPNAFEADTSDGPLDGCVNVLGSGPNWIEVEFNGSVSTGANWAVGGPMAGISPAIAWPQSGTVSA